MTNTVLDRPVAVAPAQVHQPLRLADRCDAAAVVLTKDGATKRGACGAQAFIRAVLPSGADLLFCGHCYTQHENGLAVAGAYIQDERGRINEKPTDPSRAQGF